ncbi:MAG: hypothetical protein GVX90_00450 [Alphaproteobacteria bacterium]|jgi:hypothetical protein|nr:hypothetical protein [Alphaproteobacteria bacterium]
MWTSWSNGENASYAEDGFRRFIDGLTVAPITLVQQRDAASGDCRLVARLAVSNSADDAAQLVFHEGAKASYFLLESPGLVHERVPVRVTGLKACAPEAGRSCRSVTYLYPGQRLFFYLESALAENCERPREASLRVRLGLRFDASARFREPDLEFNRLPVTGDWNAM